MGRSVPCISAHGWICPQSGQVKVRVPAGSASKLSTSVSIPVEMCRPEDGHTIQITRIKRSSAIQGEHDVASLSHRLLSGSASDPGYMVYLSAIATLEFNAEEAAGPGGQGFALNEGVYLGL
jgi:hypothetical protein